MGIASVQSNYGGNQSVSSISQNISKFSFSVGNTQQSKSAQGININQKNEATISGSTTQNNGMTRSIINDLSDLKKKFNVSNLAAEELAQELDNCDPEKDPIRFGTLLHDIKANKSILNELENYALYSIIA